MIKFILAFIVIGIIDTGILIGGSDRDDHYREHEDREQQKYLKEWYARRNKKI